MLRVDLTTTPQPISPKVILRAALFATVILALAAGYYQSRFAIWKTNNINILDKLGVQSTQEVLKSNWERK